MKTLRKFSFLYFMLLYYYCSQAAPTVISPYIKIDQFGYYPGSRKVAVIVDPQFGYNSSESFFPGTGTNRYQIRRWNDDAVVFSGTLSAWNNGSTHDQSGDKGWRFDFTQLNTPGIYYIFDVDNNVGSYQFAIGNNIYDEVLKQAVRMYFYQRINYPKSSPYSDPKWQDAACFEGSNQDRYARSRYAKTDPSTAKDLHGGWMDAGDYNKYTTFTLRTLCPLLESYRISPTVFKDDYNIPESGNGIPDLLDEIKWELDWLERMQDASGTGGLYLKVGADTYNAASPPSTDANPRYYLGECTSSTLTGAAVFALAGIVYRSIPAMKTYGDDLLNRSINAWNRATVTTNNFTSFETSCDDNDIKSGDADVSAAEQMDNVVTAAAYLFEATGDNRYKTSFETYYTQAEPYEYWWWGPYYTVVQRAMLRFARLPGVSSTVANNIISMKSAQNGVLSINDYSAATDLYRSYMPDAQYDWGSNEVKGCAGVHNYDFVTYSINSSQASLYKEVAESYLHWFHGVNPMGKVMLSNMYAYGGDDCVNEIYHSWFQDGSTWDNAKTSLYGPPPGYMPNGPNKNYPVSSVSPPYGQPPQKSFKDWNTSWDGSVDEMPWYISEPTIYAQASYISLLSRIMGGQSSTTLPLRILDFAAKKVDDRVQLNWKITATEEIDHFDVQRSYDGSVFTTIAQVSYEKDKTSYNLTDLPSIVSSRLIYRLVQVDKDGAHFYSKLITLQESQSAKIALSPNPVHDEVTIKGEMRIGGQIKIKVTDINGVSIYEKEWFQASSSFTCAFHLGHLPSGIYLVKVSQDENETIVRMVKN